MREPARGAPTGWSTTRAAAQASEANRQPARQSAGGSRIRGPRGDRSPASPVQSHSLIWRSQTSNAQKPSNFQAESRISDTGRTAYAVTSFGLFTANWASGRAQSMPQRQAGAGPAPIGRRSPALRAPM